MPSKAALFPGIGLHPLGEPEQPSLSRSSSTMNNQFRLTRRAATAGFEITEATAEMALVAFAAQWGATHPAVAQIWSRNWARIIPFFGFPPDIRKVTYTTNAIESLNMKLHKVIKTRGSFPNEKRR